MEIIHPTSPKGFIGKSLPPPPTFFVRDKERKSETEKAKWPTEVHISPAILLKLRDKRLQAKKEPLSEKYSFIFTKQYACKYIFVTEDLINLK